MPLYRSSLSREYIKIRTEARDGSDDIDPTGDQVEFAFTDADTGVDPEDDAWQAGDWETDIDTTPPTYWARILVGPGGTVTLAKGRYYMWQRPTDNPEVPVKRVGIVVIF